MKYADREFYKRIEELPAEKRALLARKLGQEGHANRPLGTGAGERSASARGPQRLVAYFVNHDGQYVSSEELREFTNSRLPDYMVPQAFVPLDDLPRMPNGKVNRQSLQDYDWSVFTEEHADFVAPRNETEDILARIWADVLGLEEVGIHDNFFEVGGDSLLSIRILARANQQGLRISPDKFFLHPTIAEQASVAGEVTKVIAESGLVTGPLPLTPIQHWFFERVQVDPHHWNQSILFSVTEDLDYPSLERAVQQILLHHDALRIRFVRGDDGMQQSIGNIDEGLPVRRVDLSSMPAEIHDAEMDRAANLLNEGFDLAKGPLLQFALIETPAGHPNRLLIVAHHLAVDAISWRILLEDLETLCGQLIRGEPMRLPPKTTSFKAWASRLVEYAQSASVGEEFGYWDREPGDSEIQVPLDFDADPGTNRIDSIGTATATLDVAETNMLLQEIPRVFNTQINDALLTALANAITRWSGHRSLLIDMEGHGREALFEDMDVSRTVGWFTTVFPVLLEAGDAADAGETLRSIKDQLRKIPHRGIGYGALREFSANPDYARKLHQTPHARVCFNYLGQLDQISEKPGLFHLEREDSGQVRSPQGIRPYLLDVNARVVDNQFRVDWTYSENFHRRETIEIVAQTFIDTLRDLVSLCRSPEAGGHTPSDFPLANLDQDELAKLSQMIGEIDDTAGADTS